MVSQAFKITAFICGTLFAILFYRSTEVVDSRIDGWSALMIKFVLFKQNAWHVPHAIDFVVPTTQGVLEKIKLPNSNISVPVHDEDYPDNPAILSWFSSSLNKHAPAYDDFSEQNAWLSDEDQESYIMHNVGNMLPHSIVNWNDRYSDRALELIAFNGLGQYRLTKIKRDANDTSYYAIYTNFMQSLEVRKGFAKYGADAFFDINGKVVKIIRGNTTYYPYQGREWDVAKFAFRSSLVTLTTAVDHLIGTHITAANLVTTANRELLPPAHPIRRLLKPFTFRSVAINYAAGRALFSTHGMLHRASSLTEKGLQDTFAFGQNSVKYESIPAIIARRSIDTINLPFDIDALDYWNVIKSFVDEYIDLYYSQNNACIADNDVRTFMANMSIPFNTCNDLKEFLTYIIHVVSGGHNFFGSIAEYISDPKFMTSAWVEGELSARPSSSIKLSLIMSVTSFKQPMITEDFSHILLDDAARDIAHKFTASLYELGTRIDARNRVRPQPFESFNPKYMQMAVSI